MSKLSLAMAASAEPAAGYITDPDEQPFSPSVFLNLPPTPPPDDDDEQDDLVAASSSRSDHLVIPFISRILMDDDDEKLSSYQCPDHQQALLQAQQPFAEILSDTTTNTFTVSPSFFPNNAVSTFGTATWPYAPVDELLFRTHPYHNVRRTGRDGLNLTTGDHASTIVFAEQDYYTTSSASVGRQFRRHNTDKGTGAGVGEGQNSSLLLGSGHQMTQIKWQDMLNQAFRKGMEEANKFLPTTTNVLPIHHSGEAIISGFTRDSRHMIAATGGQVKKHQDCWEDLEVEMDRKMADLSIAMIAPDQSDETDPEKMDKFILIKYQSVVDKMMMGTSIAAMDTEAEKKSTKKGKRKSMMAMNNYDTAVDMRALLMQCAHAVATGNRHGVTELLYKIKQHASQSGDATQRVAHYFAPALEARLDGMGSQLYKSLMVKKLTSANELLFLEAYQLIVSVSCFKMMAFMFSNLTILKAVASSRRRRRKKVHIVDYGEHYGFQWPTLLGNLATSCREEEGPPEVRITCIVLPKSGYRPTARIEETGRRLSNFAGRCGIPFKFRGIVANRWETVCADDLDTEPDEVLIVNGLADFGRVMDESVHNIDSPSPRDMVLKNIQKMRPDVLILFIENSSYNTPFFLSRFREALFFHSALFDMMDAVAPRDNNDRVLFEQNLGRHAFNIIACEGWDRVERPEKYKQWQVRNNRAGLRQLPLDPDIVKAVSNKVCENYSREFVVDVDEQWFLQGWKGRILYAMSTWAADDTQSHQNCG